MMFGRSPSGSCVTRARGHVPAAGRAATSAPLLVEQIFEVIRGINREGSTILVVQQNAMMAQKRRKRGYVLQTGTVVLEGQTADLQADPEVKRACLGQ